MTHRIHLKGQILRPGQKPENVELIAHQVHDSDPIQHKSKTADESKASDITLADDTHLSGYILEPDAYYKMEGYLSYTQNVGNIAWRWQFSDAPQEFGMTFSFVDEASVENSQHTNAHDVILSEQNMTDTVDASGVLHGLIKANATAGGTLDFQWSQQTSSANNTTIYEGSWIRIEKLNIV
jgi:hypothetical protein